MKRPDHKSKIIEKFSKKKILDVGCGNKKTYGSIGLDFVSFNDVDVVHNLNVFHLASQSFNRFTQPPSTNIFYSRALLKW